MQCLVTDITQARKNKEYQRAKKRHANYPSTTSRMVTASKTYKRELDSVWRVGLWKKPLANNINGKLFRIVFNMYKDKQCCEEQSSFFSSFRSV